MGLILAVPLILLASVIRKRYFSCSKEHQDKGLIFQIKQTLNILLLKVYKFGREKKLQNHVCNIDDEIDRIGLIPLKEDIDFEFPSTVISRPSNIVDEVAFSGFNSHNDHLVLRLSRRSDNRLEVFIYLKIIGNGIYQLPSMPDTRAFSNDLQNFSSCGLKVKCLTAMRKWRISYNGFLKKIDADQKSSEDIVHVKFSFIWTTLSIGYDCQTDINLYLLSEAICSNYWYFPVSTLSKLKERLNRYEQLGQLSGTVSINNEDEQEIYLWGPRIRDKGLLDWSEVNNYVRIYGYMADGMMFHITMMSIEGIITNFKYGYVILPNRFLHTIQSCDFKFSNNSCDDKLVFIAGEREYVITCERSKENFDVYFGEKWEIFSSFYFSNFSCEGVGGKGYVEFGRRNEMQLPPPVRLRKPCLLQIPAMKDNIIPFVVDFKNYLCQIPAISGGKGASLAKLNKLCLLTKNDKLSDNFIVPRGIVVTISSYRYHMSMNKELSEEISSLSKNFVDINQASERITAMFLKTFLSEEIKSEILKKLEEIFKEELSNIIFAVRSSSVDEDSAETSAAGQMDTYLGIRKFDQIFEYILKCWSSQFSRVALNYKKQTGQLINSDMAVVIQEMVSAETAGVVFTCDPITGNPAEIIITANYGLGESVVSGTVEPDTIILQRNIDNKITIHSQTIGQKKSKISISDQGGTISKILTEENKLCCINPDQACKIGQIAIMVEEAFGNPRDIEWAIVRGQIYLLQARPITTYDSETEFEIIHELDTGILTETEYLTKANVGEVLPGALTPLTLSTTSMLMELGFQHEFHQTDGPSFYKCHPQFPTTLVVFYNHAFFGLVDTILNKVQKDENSFTYNWQLSLFGRLLENRKELKDIGLHRYGIFPKWKGFVNLISIILSSFTLRRKLKLLKEEVESSYLPENMDFISSNLLYTVISQILPKYCKASVVHAKCSTFSSMCNVFILAALENMKQSKDEKLFVDFSKLVSNCEQVESLDVPKSLQNLSEIIMSSKEKDNFLKMTAEEASKWLENETSNIGLKYREFLKQHGHRCFKEFEMFIPTWRSNPTELVKSLQIMVNCPNNISAIKSPTSPKAAVNELNLSINKISKFILTKLAEWARHGVCDREKSKSVAIKYVDVYRRAYTKLGQVMEKEGRIPDSNLIFFFTHEEIGRLLKTRSAHLITKAIRRRRVHPKLNSLKFPEMTVGPPKPIQREIMEVDNNNSEWVITGTPIYHGVVKGPARVIMDLEEAHTIQSGDILVTYGTDIGWSPYFPLVSGVVTELGGLLSHGAVVAREYGLPCIIAAHGATSIIRSGDIAILDGRKGILKKA